MRRGFWTAAIIGCLGLMMVFVNPVVGLLHAALFFAVAWGIRRGHFWAALTGLFLVVSPAITVAMRFRTSDARENGQMGALLVSAGLALACAYLFLRAAVDLHRSGHARAAASLPWAVIIGAVGAAWLLFQPMVIPTSAMEQTLLAGDHVVVENAGALARRSPKRGELVVFRYPVDRRNIFVKRIIGVPGDRLRFRGKRLYRNGAPVDEPYAYLATSHTDSYRDNFPGVPNLRLYAPGEAMLKENVRDDEVIVPEGKFFVLGDNRDNSLDSRYWGFISKSDIIGRPILIYASYDVGPSMTDSDRTLTIRNLRWNRLFTLL